MIMRVLLLVLLCSCATVKPYRWRWYDAVGEVAFMSVWAMDYHQTLQIVRDGTENNPIIGERGQRMHPNIYFPLALFLHVTLCTFLTQPARGSFQFLSTAILGVTVWNNHVDGISPAWWR